jgi:superfamily II DNA/RNA helicase
MSNETSAGAEAGLEVSLLESSSSNDQNTPAPEAEAETEASTDAASTPVADEAVSAEPEKPVEPPKEPEITFDDLGLSEEVLKAVKETGYTTPTPIQAKSIPQVLMGRDIVGIAQTGTGKTASFTLPMIEILARGRAKARMPRSLILAPTRELAAQVAESFERYGKYNKLSMALLIGGVSFEDQDRKLDRGVDVLIATPGRLMDHFERGKLMLTGVQVLVIDEADRMLDMGFIPDVEKICKLLPFTRQTLFYSATMPPEITRLTEQFLHNPARIEVARPATTAANITQEIIEVVANDWAKRETLRRLIRDNPVKNGIIFCNRKRDVDVVARSLSKHGFSAAPLHGDLDQSMRMKTLDAFKSGDLQLLVASDVAARGLDIPAVSHIFNYDAPFHADDYVHRIGRTGRAGRSGHAFMLVSPRDAKSVDAIERLIKKTLPRSKVEGIEPREDLKPRGDRDRDRRGGRGRGRDRGRDRPVKDHGQRASIEPAARAEPVETAETPKPEKARGESRGRKPAKMQTQENLPPHMEGATADAAQLPHALLRPVKLPSAKTAADEAAELAEAEASHAAEAAADAATVEAKTETQTEAKPKPARKTRARKAKTKTKAAEPASEEVKAEDATAEHVKAEAAKAEDTSATEAAPEAVAEPAAQEGEADEAVSEEKPKPKRKTVRKRAPRAKKAVKAKAEDKAAETASDAPTEAPAEVTEAAEADAPPPEEKPRAKRKVARKRTARAKKAAAKSETGDTQLTDETPAE